MTLRELLAVEREAEGELEVAWRNLRIQDDEWLRTIWHDAHSAHDQARAAVDAALDALDPPPAPVVDTCAEITAEIHASEWYKLAIEFEATYT